MTQGYPTSILIARIIDDSGHCRSEFVHKIGYGNPAKGLRRLDEWLEHGRGDLGCLHRIADTFHPAPGELEDALAATEKIHQLEHQEAAQQIEERERLRFRPFVWVHTVGGARSFLAAMGESQIKVLWLGEGFERLSNAEQLTTVQRRVRKHYEQTGGRYIGFGAILRYRYAATFDSSMVLDINGNVIEKAGGRFLLPEVWLELHRANLR